LPPDDLVTCESLRDGAANLLIGKGVPMTRTTIAALAACSLIALGACNKQATGNADQNAAASGAASIDGTWKTDLSTLKIDSKPDQYLLKDGQFSCPTCTPPLTLAADGAFHAVTGRPYADSMAIKVDDAHDVTRTAKKANRVTGEGKYSVSADGNTLTINFSDSSTPNAPPVTGSLIETRVAPAPAGAHAISGSWKPAKYGSVSDEALTVTYKLDGDTLHMSSAGQSYDAKLDGSDAPIKGDIGGTVVSVHQGADGSITETDKRDGKVISVTTLTPSSDGKLSVSSEDKVRGSTSTSVANKQS
jgi:hypothetical protein